MNEQDRSKGKRTLKILSRTVRVERQDLGLPSVCRLHCLKLFEIVELTTLISSIHIKALLVI